MTETVTTTEVNMTNTIKEIKEMTDLEAIKKLADFIESYSEDDKANKNMIAIYARCIKNFVKDIERKAS